MKPGKTELRLNAEIEKRGALFAVLLDPDTSDEAAFVKAGALAAENGADLLLVGGSYLGNFTLPKQVAALKAHVDLPVVLFPGGASQVVPGFDAMLFMTLVSGRNPNYLIDEQVRGGALVRALSMEAIPTAYQLINSGKRTTVEYISGTMPVPANKPKLSMVNSIAAELMGMRYVYLEAGSGAEEPVPVEHIAYTRKATEMTIITGGGIKDPQTAAVRVAAPLLGNGIFVDGEAKCVLSSAVTDVFHAGVHERHTDAGQTGQVVQDMLDAFGVVMDPHGATPFLSFWLIIHQLGRKCNNLCEFSIDFREIGCYNVNG